MSFSRHVPAAVAAGLSAVTLTLGLGGPAQAAGPGWHVVFTHHYGSPGTGSFYYAVVAPSSDGAWAFGATNPSGQAQLPVAARWNGTAWHNTPLPSGLSGIYAAGADSASDVWAVTNLGGDILHWNGTAWAVAKRLTGEGQLTGVTALSPTDVWVFGGGGAIGGLGTWHYDGSTWTEQTGAALGIDHASALSPADIWAIGTGGVEPQDALVHYNGTTWTRIKARGLAGLGFSDIVALPGDNVWLVTNSLTTQLGGSLIHVVNGKATLFKIPWAIDPRRLAPDGHGGFWLSASSNHQSYAVHRSASGKWSRVPLSITGLALIPGTTSLWAAGAVGTTAAGENAAVFAHGTP